MKNLIKILLFAIFIISTNSCMVGYTGSVPSPNPYYRPYYYSPYYPYYRYNPYSPYYYRSYPYYRYSPPARPPRQNYGPRRR